MTKARFAELVLIKMGGGHIDNQMSVDRRTIRAYMPAAINLTMLQGYTLEIKEEGDRDFSSMFYGYYPTLTVQEDTERHNWKYFSHPKVGIALPRNQDIRQVEDNLGNTYIALPDSAMKSLNYYLPLMEGIGFYRREQGKIYLFNAPELIQSINFSGIIDCDSLVDTDILPIPAGLETEAIQNCFEFVSGIRQLPADRKNDKRDIN